MTSALRDIGRDGALETTIRNEIIPRLMLAFRQVASEDAPGAADAETIARLALDGDDAGASAYLDALAERGVTLGDVFLNVLAPAARIIGAAWESDERSFGEVSVALTRLHRLFRERQPQFEGARALGDAPRALIAPAPGEDHILGALMVEAFFIRAGWTVDSRRFETADQLAAAVRAQPFDLVGLSIGRTAAVPNCRAVIETVRAESANPNVVVMAGGEGVRRSGAVAEDLGADAIADDAAQAVHLAETLRAHAQSVRAG